MKASLGRSNIETIRGRNLENITIITQAKLDWCFLATVSDLPFGEGDIKVVIYRLWFIALMKVQVSPI